MSIDEPVLLMAFNRPELMKRVVDRLSVVKPRNLYVAIDGPRENRPDELAKVEQCRSLTESVNWDCDLRTLFQDANLGCGLGVSTAISWFFDQVDRGIILEDDILPDPSFFPFCSELLDRYANDDRVFAISGCNFVPPSHISHPDLAYRFSRVPHIWGWATWRRSWAQHRLDIQGWRGELPMHRLWQRSGRSIPGTVYWAATFELLAKKQVDTWDGQLVLAGMVSDQLTATCNRNLIRNIGFGPDATHTLEDRDELQPVVPITVPTQPVPVEVDERADAWTRRHHFRATPRGMLGQFRRFIDVRRGVLPS